MAVDRLARIDRTAELRLREYGPRAILGRFALALGDVAQHLDASALQAVHVLNEDLVLTLTVGTSEFLLGAGLATLQTRALPRTEATTDGA